MRQCGENQIGLIELRVFRRDEGDLASGNACALAALSVSCSEAKLETRMAGDERAKLSARVAAGAKNADRKFMHK